MITKTHSKKWYIGLGVLAILAVLLLAARLYLGVWVLQYVNKSLNNIPHYQGSVEDIDIELWRGAYKIHKLKISKKDGNIPTPFVDIELVDLSIQWAALLHGRVVSDIALERPVINFAVNKSSKQTGTEADWTKPIKALAPVDINHVTFRDGKLAYRDFSSSPKVDIFIHHMNGEVSNLRNVEDASKPLPSALLVKGDSIGEGKLQIKGHMNILKPVPDMDLTTQLEDVHLPALNSYSNAYAALDFKGGTISIYSEFKIINNNVSGYVKPIAKHISLVDLSKDANPIKVIWESLASTIITIFTNQRNDQFATKVDLDGSLAHIDTDTWSAVGGILSNAFVSAIKKGFDNDSNADVPPKKAVDKDDE